MDELKGIIFDLDGTLLLSMHIWDTVGSEYIKKQGLVPDPDTDYFIKVMTIEEAAAYFKEHYLLEKTVEEITREINSELENQYFNIVQPKDGVLDFLEAFHRRGVKMCVATATDRYLVEPAMKRCGIYDYLEGVLTCTEVGIGKVSPEIYRRASELLGLPKENVAVFEDALYAARTAKKDGFFLVGIYDDSFKEKQEELKALADIYIEDYTKKDIAKLI